VYEKSGNRDTRRTGNHGKNEALLIFVADEVWRDKPGYQRYPV
jgi:hypothetical protein